MKNVFLAASTSAGLAISVMFPSHVIASSFEALCESDIACAVSVDGEMLSVGPLKIASQRIIGWGETEAKSKRKPELCLLSLTACALTIFHDYRYYVDYANDEGVVSKTMFKFVNDKPAKQLVRELTSLTNLASGQSSEAATQWAEKRRSEIEYQILVDSLNCSPVLKPFKCSYRSYLDANPGAREWAAKNPVLAKNQMIQMKSVETFESK